jgi:HD-like signal output (HDOD) protein
MRQEWQMHFVNSGQEALEIMERIAFDVIVTDMRMPQISGAQLLEIVKERFPQCLRMVLSGQADRETILRAVTPTHQYVAKPCEAKEFQSRLERAFAIKELLQNPNLKGLLSKLGSIPTLPAMYSELTRVLEKEDPSMSEIARLISSDMAMAAKVLQFANSAFFGIQGEVSDPLRAVQILGLDIIKALVLSTHVFSTFQNTVFDAKELQHLREQSITTARYAKTLAIIEESSKQTVENCFTSALLHDSGKLVLGSVLRDDYKRVLKRVRSGETTLLAAEMEMLGCTHAEVAAYLFGLWGLPSSIIEGIAWHHRPSKSPKGGFCTVTTTHIASFYYDQHFPSTLNDHIELDTLYLERIGGLPRQEKWWAALEQSHSLLLSR